MSLFLLAARVVLALVFAIAGIGKLRDLSGSRHAVADFGIRPRPAHAIGTVLPFLELVVACTLLLPGGARAASLAAIALLGAFVVGIAVNLRRGRRPDCHCFGQIHSEPIGWRTLARNGTLIALAALILWRGPGAAGLLPASGSASLEVQEGALIALAGAAALAVQLWFGRPRTAHNHEMGAHVPSSASTPQPLAVGSAAPPFTLPDLSGSSVTLAELYSGGRAALLIFSDPNCTACEALLRDVERWCVDFGDVLTVALISRGDARANRKKTRWLSSIPVLLQNDFEVASAYVVTGTPSAIIVHPGGVVGSPLAAGPETIRLLLRQFLDLLSIPAVEEVDAGMMLGRVEGDSPPDPRETQ